MTFDKFIDLLKGTKGKFDWALDGEAIRAFTGKSIFCPLTAVCAQYCGKAYPIDRSYVAYKKLGLGEDNILNYKIVTAADTGDVSLLRTKMLQALDLENDS